MEALFLDFVNSRWPADHGQGADWLGDLSLLNAKREQWGLPPQATLTPGQSQALITLRTLLTDAVTALASGDTPTTEAMTQLNAHLARAFVHYTLEPTPGGRGCQAVLHPADETVNALQLAVVHSFAQFLAEHDPARLRICDNPDCRWAFYDETRNASRRWCGPTCSSLIKVRRYRARHA